MWVIRAGKKGIFHDQFIKTECVFLSWEGYHFDLRYIDSMDACRDLVAKEKKTNNKTSISNWAGQLYAFIRSISVGDYALIPAYGSRTYSLVRITGNYEYDEAGNDQFYHFRAVRIINTDIPRSIFTQATVYSLNAYRTIFRVKNEDIVMQAIKEWEEAIR